MLAMSVLVMICLASASHAAITNRAAGSSYLGNGEWLADKGKNDRQD